MLKEIQTRKSARSFADRPVSDEQVLDLLEAARLAPSGSNTQPWQFVVARSEEARGKICAANHHQQWMLQAPVHIACVADIRSRVPAEVPITVDENSPQEELKQIIRDTAIAAEHIVLEAEALGLASCWTAWYTQSDMREALGVPADKYVVGVIVVGYPDKPAGSPKKKGLDTMIHHEQW